MASPAIVSHIVREVHCRRSTRAELALNAIAIRECRLQVRLGLAQCASRIGNRSTLRRNPPRGNKSTALVDDPFLSHENAYARNDSVMDAVVIGVIMTSRDREDIVLVCLPSYAVFENVPEWRNW